LVKTHNGAIKYMIYVSIDIETTGLNPETCQILSIGAIIEDTQKQLTFEEIPKFHCAILRGERDIISGELYALNMNKDLIETITQYSTAEDQDEKNDLVHFKGMQFVREEDIAEHFFQFLYRNGLGPNEPDLTINKRVKMVNGIIYPIVDNNVNPIVINVAGKNFSGFDRRFLDLLPKWKRIIRTRSRVIDPGVLFVDWKNDDVVPSLDSCKKRASIEGEVTHNALEDAWDVVKLLRTKY
jgi:hypothetical protein